MKDFHLSADSIFWHKNVHETFSGFDVKLNKTMDFQMLLEFALNQPKSAFIRSEKEVQTHLGDMVKKTAGYKFEEHQEHLYLAQKYNYKDKYSFFGKIKKIKVSF